MELGHCQSSLNWQGSDEICKTENFSVAIAEQKVNENQTDIVISNFSISAYGKELFKNTDLSIIKDDTLRVFMALGAKYRHEEVAADDRPCKYGYLYEILFKPAFIKMLNNNAVALQDAARQVRHRHGARRRRLAARGDRPPAAREAHHAKHSALLLL